MLWEVLRRFGRPDKFVNIIIVFHTGMTATALVAGEVSESFEIGVGVEHGCAMAPVLFNMYLAATDFLFAQQNEDEFSILLTHRLDGSLFNLDLLKAYTKVKHERVSALQYADDCAFVAHSPEDLRHYLADTQHLLLSWAGHQPSDD